MSNISLLDKLKYFIEYKLSILRNSNPYKRIVMNEDLTTYKKNTKIMNSIHQEKINVDTFSPTRVVVLYTSDRVFTTVLIVTSYTEIDKAIQEIITNQISYPKKIFADYPTVIDHIYLLTYDKKEIDVTNTILTCIEYKNIPIKFRDICIILKKQVYSIEKIKIRYYDQITLTEMTVEEDFGKIRDCSIDLIHDMTTGKKYIISDYII